MSESSRTIRTIVGIVLTAAGIAGWFILPHRSEWIALALVAIGAWNIDMVRAKAGLKAAGAFLGSVLGRGSS